MHEDEVRQLLRLHAKSYGTQQALAHAIDISPQYLGEILSGVKAPSKQVLDWLGMERRVEYFRVTPTNEVS